MPRDWLEISRQIDRWTLLGLPLLIFPTMPSIQSNGASNMAQAEWVKRFVRLLLAKPAVQAIFWRLWQDTPSSSRWSNSGFVDMIGDPKPALKACFQIREAYLS